MILSKQDLKKLKWNKTDKVMTKIKNVVPFLLFDYLSKKCTSLRHSFNDFTLHRRFQQYESPLKAITIIWRQYFVKCE